MAWRKLTSFLVIVVCRFTLFLFISMLSWILLGIPNINTCFLTAFISSMIPLPSASYLIHPIDCLWSKVCLALKAYKEYTIVFSEVNRVIFVSLPQNLLRLVLFGWLESILRCVVDQIRFTIPNMTSKVILTASKATCIMFIQLLPCLQILAELLAELVRLSLLGIRFFSRLVIRMVTTLLIWASSLFYRLVPLQIVLFLRRSLRWLPVAGAVLVCVPGLEPIPNLLVTGHFYPGSLIRFQRCAKYEDSTACHASFLELSYSVWNVMRTGIFIIVCRTTNGHAWRQSEFDLTTIIERCLVLNNVAYLQLLLCAAGMPLLMAGHCFSQSVHNVLCILCLLLFLITLNGYHSRTVLMASYALCCVVMNVQSVFVALYNIYGNLQTQRVDYIVTLVYIVELYFMLLVAVDSSARVIYKVVNPERDIMTQDSSWTSADYVTGSSITSHGS